MLKQAVDYARKCGLKPEPGFKFKRAKWAIACQKGGKYLGVVELGDTSLGRKNPGREILKAPDLTQPQLLGGPPGCRQFLVDSLGVVTLLGLDKPSPKEEAKHEFFVNQLEEAAGKAPALQGLARLLRDSSQRELINQELLGAGAKPTDNASFMVEEAFLPDDDCWHDWWRGWMDKAFAPKQTAPMLDILKGRECIPQPTHFKLSGLAGVGGQPSGDALVSFDKDAFTSYGLKQSANAAFSEQSAKDYAESLNFIIRKHGKVMAGALVTYWYTEPLSAPDRDDPVALIFAGDEELTGLSAMAQAESLLNAIRNGERPQLVSNRFCALTMSGQAGRVMVRDWREGSFESLAESVHSWFADLAIEHRDGGRLAPDPKLWALLGATVRDLDEIKPLQVIGLWVAALGNKPIPRWALAKCLARMKVDIIQGETIRHARVQLLKACLLRDPSVKGGSDLSPYLNENHPEPAYQCGRLMAVYARLQRAALGDVGAGVVQRYYAAATSTPALVLGRLATLGKAHLGKLDGGLSHWYEQLLASVWSQIDHELPTTLSLDEQSLFALGYYQQLAHMNRPKKDQTTAPVEA